MMYLGKDPVGLATSIPKFGNIAKIECGSYIPTQDILITDVSIPHSLGYMPDFYLYYATDFNLEAYETVYALSGLYYPIYTDNNVQKYYLLCRYIKLNSTTLSNITGTMDLDTLSLHGVTNNTFKFIGNTNSLLKANITYNYIIGKFKEVTSNANE